MAITRLRGGSGRRAAAAKRSLDEEKNPPQGTFAVFPILKKYRLTRPLLRRLRKRRELIHGGLNRSRRSSGIENAVGESLALKSTLIVRNKTRNTRGLNE